MCGIFAAVGRKLPGSALENVFGALRHRGPDGRGLFVDAEAHLTFAHTRLAVIDLETGDQPLESEDGNIVLVANGEIYEFERIRRSLEAKGHKFRSGSDSEVILYLYKEFGLGCFEHLRGEFAFLLYDREKRQLIAARDRFGIKPLYFTRLERGFVFASEMKAIFASGLVAPKLNVLAFDPLLDSDPDNARFPFVGIEQVPPGCYLTVDLDSCELTSCRYWSAEIPDVVAEPAADSSPEAASASERIVLQQLDEAVRLRLRADVPVGLYLSGGVDSAFVGALMERNLKSTLHSFSIAFEGSGRSERQSALHSAKFIGTQHHELTVTKSMLWDNLERCLWFSELPFVSLAPVGKFLLSEEARKFVTVVLTGEGADEVFLGYRFFFQKAIRETRSGQAAGRTPSPQLRRLKFGPWGLALLQRFSLLLFHKSQRRRIAEARSIPARGQRGTKPLINAVQEARIAGMPLDILCYLGDREEMAHSLEARLPFLDHKLYDAAKQIPVDFKVRDGREKAVLRDAAKGILPDEIRLRRKGGFMATSDAVDLFGADRKSTGQFARYLSRQAFESAGLFSYRAFRTARLLAMLPGSGWLRPVKQLRRNSNKAIMYMMQVHMLHDMFVVRPPWSKCEDVPAKEPMGSEKARALVS
ncbi:MAG TPA: asparagine synthase (glutamine-hydrolyzing) [Sphingomicrobium sp.]|nr:asparagine synthase (glutamine-hydrolyzing) [Sphingomicrobium sp.]